MKFVIIFFVLILISCRESYDSFQYKDIKLEIDLNQFFNNANKESKNNTVNNLVDINSMEIVYFNDYIYFRNNYLYSFLLALSLKKRYSILISDIKPQINISLLSKFINNVNYNKPDKNAYLPILHLESKLDYILAIAPDFNYGFYLMLDENLSYYKTYKEINDKKSISFRREKNNKANKNFLDVDNNPRRYISRYNSRGEFLYDIDIRGKVYGPGNAKQFFNPFYVPYLLFVDFYGYLYFISKGFENEVLNYRLYRYNSRGELDFYIDNIYDWLDCDKNIYCNIEKILITSKSQKLLVLTSYYDGNYINGNNFKFKKLLAFDFISKNKFDYNVVSTFDNSMKSFSLFGVTLNDKIFFYSIGSNMKNSSLVEKYYFKVFNISGKLIGVKTINFNNNSYDSWRWVKLGLDEKILIFTYSGFKLIGDFYH